MLDLVPFARGRRQVANGNSQAGLIGQLLQLLFPEPIARPIGATPISHDQEFCTRLDRVCCPMLFHQRLMLSTANSAVSWSIPTLTKPLFCSRS